MLTVRRKALATMAARRGAAPTTTSRLEWRAGLLALLVSAFLVALTAASPASADEDENYKIVQGLGVYLGVLPAGILRGHPESQPETTMHGGAPRGAHQYHIIIAVFDVSTGARVENAQVMATVSGLGHVGQNSVDLEPMTIAGTVTYGNFVKLPGNDRYNIAFDIRVPGRKTPVQVHFTYQHLR